jgi:hypothetical protein
METTFFVYEVAVRDWIIVNDFISRRKYEYFFIFTYPFAFCDQNLYICEWFRVRILSFIAQSKITEFLCERIGHFKWDPLMIIGVSKINFDNRRPIFLTIVNLQVKTLSEKDNF